MEEKGSDEPKTPKLRGRDVTVKDGSHGFGLSVIISFGFCLKRKI